MDKYSAKWFCSTNKNAAEQQLIIFPHAGGNAMYYLPMERYIGDAYRLMCVNLPGRDIRANTPMYSSLRMLARDFVDENESILNNCVPYVLMGHSMGAIIAYEVASYIEEKNMKLPERLIVSGAGSPADAEKNFKEVSLNEQDIEEYLIGLGGTSEQVLEMDEFREYYLPIIFSDFKACGNYFYRERLKLSVPINVFYGNEDNSIDPRFYSNWKKYTISSCEETCFEGDHFFVQSSMRDVCKKLVELAIKR